MMKVMVMKQKLIAARVLQRKHKTSCPVIIILHVMRNVGSSCTHSDFIWVKSPPGHFGCRLFVVFLSSSSMHVHTTNVAVSSLRLCIRELTSSNVGQETGFYHWICRGFPQFAQKNAGLLSHATKDFFPHFFPVYNPNVAVLFNGVCLKSRQHKAFISKSMWDLRFPRLRLWRLLSCDAWCRVFWLIADVSEIHAVFSSLQAYTWLRIIWHLYWKLINFLLIDELLSATAACFVPCICISQLLAVLMF
jgi:hypothetical protein